jgi:protein-L-isoaspartate(D-aspartate) O-methyltransferase
VAGLAATLLLSQAAPCEQPRYESQRRALVASLRGDGIRDERVLAAMNRVPRHELVPEALRSQAYEDRPLPIGLGQTISQPYIVAFMTETVRVRPGDRVLEIGTGSGYQAAVLAELGVQVYSIEILAPIAERARKDLSRLGYGRVRLRVGDGYGGWPEAAPFDAIIVTAAPEDVPRPLVDQLKPGGRLVLPVGASGSQELVLITKRTGGEQREQLLPVRFVPMIGQAERRAQ